MLFCARKILAISRKKKSIKNANLVSTALYSVEFTSLSALLVTAIDRRIRADILDRDLFDKSPNTPAHTSWTMDVLSQLDEALGPGVWDKPIFPATPANELTSPQRPSTLTILEELKNGSYDSHFGSTKKLSEL
jgi:hypothetical protein